MIAGNEVQEDIGRGRRGNWREFPPTGRRSSVSFPSFSPRKECEWMGRPPSRDRMRSWSSSSSCGCGDQEVLTPESPPETEGTETHTHTHIKCSNKSPSRGEPVPPYLLPPALRHRFGAPDVLMNTRSVSTATANLQHLMNLSTGDRWQLISVVQRVTARTSCRESAERQDARSNQDTQIRCDSQ